jgi:hypothetical protein
MMMMMMIIIIIIISSWALRLCEQKQPISDIFNKALSPFRILFSL